MVSSIYISLLLFFPFIVCRQIGTMLFDTLVPWRFMILQQDYFKPSVPAGKSRNEEQEQNLVQSETTKRLFQLEAFPGLRQASKMESLATIVNGQLLLLLPQHSILGICRVLNIPLFIRFLLLCPHNLSLTWLVSYLTRTFSV